jgi:hypothetical protein
MITIRRGTMVLVMGKIHHRRVTHRRMMVLELDRETPVTVAVLGVAVDR